MKFDWNAIEKLLQEISKKQYDELYACGQRIIPSLTSEDMLQPNDFPELENHPIFRYEEGVLAGIQTVQMALKALKKDQELSIEESI